MSTFVPLKKQYYKPHARKKCSIITVSKRKAGLSNNTVNLFQDETPKGRAQLSNHLPTIFQQSPNNPPNISLFLLPHEAFTQPAYIRQSFFRLYCHCFYS